MSAVQTRALHVLLVEDNPMNVELARDLFEVGGHRVTVAGSGAALRALIDGGTVPSIVLMDILLPDTNGVTLLRELRTRPQLARVPIVAVTAQALTGDEARLLEAGFAAVITKPINTRRFVADVEGYANHLVNEEPDGSDPDRRR